MVLLKGSQPGASTGSAGYYQLAGLPRRGGTLVFSLVGYETRERAAPAQGTVLNIVLRSGQEKLSAVVVTGAAPAQQRHDVLRSVATVTVADELQGRAAGVAITPNPAAKRAGLKTLRRALSSASRMLMS